MRWNTNAWKLRLNRKKSRNYPLTEIPPRPGTRHCRGKCSGNWPSSAGSQLTCCVMDCEWRLQDNHHHHGAGVPGNSSIRSERICRAIHTMASEALHQWLVVIKLRHVHPISIRHAPCYDSSGLYRITGDVGNPGDGTTFPDPQTLAK